MNDSDSKRITWTRKRACGKYGPDGERITYEDGVEVSTWGHTGGKCEVDGCTARAGYLEINRVQSRYGYRWQDRYWLCREHFESRAKDGRFA